MKASVTKQGLIDWLSSLKSDLKKGDAPKVYTRISQTLMKLENNEVSVDASIKGKTI